MREHADHAVKLPELDVIVLNQKGSAFERLGVTIAVEVVPSDDVTARVHHKCTIVHFAPHRASS